MKLVKNEKEKTLKSGVSDKEAEEAPEAEAEIILFHGVPDVIQSFVRVQLTMTNWKRIMVNLHP